MQDLETIGVVPVVVLDNLSHASPLGDALVEGGLACAEVTLRTEASLEIIATLSRRGDMLIGAGTVLSIRQADLAIDAGAHFLVSPGFDRDVVAYAQLRGIPVLPGIASATEVQAAMRMGLEHLKFFPAIPAGGLPMLSALHGPFPTVRFMPTGGIALDSLEGYITHPAVFAVGGSWMVPRSKLEAGEFELVMELTRATVAHMTTLRVG